MHILKISEQFSTEKSTNLKILLFNVQSYRPMRGVKVEEIVEQMLSFHNHTHFLRPYRTYEFLKKRKSLHEKFKRFQL
jgi:hypothetical protein